MTLAAETTWTWMAPSDWQAYDAWPSVELRAERSRRKQVKAEQDRQWREANAAHLRKRVRRIEEEKEDRDALRELASSRNDGTILALDQTPAGLREVATDGTPRSAKAAGAKLRELTQSIYRRLQDPRFYGVSCEDLQVVQVGMGTGTRPLKRFGGNKKRRPE